MIEWLVMKWCKWQLKKLRKADREYVALEIKGTGKHYPDYLIFTDIEQTRRNLEVYL